MVDHREMVLQAVKQRYQADKFCGVGATIAMSHTELCNILGVSEEVVAMGDATEELKLDCAVNDLIMSPCHTSKRRSSITQRCVLFSLGHICVCPGVCGITGMRTFLGYTQWDVVIY